MRVVVTPSTVWSAVATASADVGTDTAMSMVTRASHELTPPQTPQLSMGAVSGQQMPAGDSGVLQQTPRTSTATPLPPHTPQASSLSGAQHMPPASVTLPTVQHIPVTPSTAPVQQAPVTSTTPASHAAGPDSSGTEHAEPAQPLWHSHTPAVEHVLCISVTLLEPSALTIAGTVTAVLAMGQSSFSEHLHGKPLSHGSVDGGIVTALHAASLTALPSAVTHATGRVRCPNPHVVETPPAITLCIGTHADHGPARHTNVAAAHGCTLHSRVSVAGGVTKPAAAHCASGTTTSLRVHACSATVDVPAVVLCGAMHAAEHCDHRAAGCHTSLLHSEPMHDCRVSGTGSGGSSS
jgi:hypothetical protein